jgi:hypothetical protein
MFFDIDMAMSPFDPIIHHPAAPEPEVTLQFLAEIATRFTHYSFDFVHIA